jgi:purine-cytosine permease-like protein
VIAFGLLLTLESVCRWDNGTLWFSVNACVGTFGVGYLGNLYWDMGLRDSALTIVFFNLLSCAPVAYMSTFGKVRRVAQIPHRFYIL